MVLYTVFNGEYQRIIRLHFRGSATYPAKRPSPSKMKILIHFGRFFYALYGRWRCLLYTHYQYITKIPSFLAHPLYYNRTITCKFNLLKERKRKWIYSLSVLLFAS